MRRWLSFRPLKAIRQPRPGLQQLESRDAPAIFTVTNTGTANTAGSGTLRRAITDANALAGIDTIQFAIPGTGVQTIKSNVVLTITEGVVIDGWSQPGFTTTPLIELTKNSGENTGLLISNGNTTIQGLIINNFDNDCIYFQGGSNYAVKGCWVGTDKTGLLDKGATWGVSLRDAGNSTIGGTTSKDRNVISGNDLDNVRVWGPNADGTKIIGNYIGTDTTGLAPIGNKAGQGGTRGVWLGDEVPADIGSPDHITVGGLNPGERNVICGMSGVGVLNTLATHDNLIQGNYLGVGADGATVITDVYGVIVEAGSSSITIDRNLITSMPVGGTNNVYGQGVCIGTPAGTASNNIVTGNTIGLTADGSGTLGHCDHGIVIFNAAGNRVGGLTAAERNVVANCVFDCVGMYGSTSANNVVQGNFLGTDVTGTKGLGLSSRGVWLGDNYPPSIGAAHNNTVGGTAAGAGNVIGASVAGVILTLGANLNTIQGNKIGTDLSGTIKLGNTFGVFVEINAANNIIGGSTPGAGNVIANSIHDGILVGYDKLFSGQQTPAGVGNLISGNSIYDNGDLGIDLGSDDIVTPNDNFDADTGPNQLQNYPTVVSAKSGATTLISGVLKSAANTTYTIEAFASKSANASGFGEGGRYLGSTTVTTDATGRAMFIDKSIAGASTAGEFITTTARDAAGNTSEFSNAVASDILPRVTSVTVNAGQTQRSRVTSLALTFNQYINLPGTPATAFQLKRQSDNATVALTTNVATDTFTSVTFTFNGALSETTSLADGRYTLTVLSASAGNANGPLDGDNNGTAGDNYVLVGDPAVTPKLFRLYGDSTADGTVNSFDFLPFRLSYLQSNPIFDFDGNNTIDSNDFLQFRLRFLKFI